MGVTVVREDVSFEKGETYKDMGLLREAIAEFEKAMSDNELKFRATRRIAACLLSLDRPLHAEKVLIRALCLPDLKKYDRLSIYADLADLYTQLDRPEAALERLLSIQNEDPSFVSDLGERLLELSESVDFSLFDKPLSDLDWENTDGLPEARGGELREPLPVDATSHYQDPRRRAPRYKFSNRVHYSFDQIVWQTGYSTDISTLGIFVLTHQPIFVGSLVFLKFEPPNSIHQNAIEIIGQVVRQENKRHQKGAVLGMGVHFVSLNEELRDVLTALVDWLSTQEKKDIKKVAMLRFHCDACGRIITAPEALSGKPGKCVCGESVPVPFSHHNPTPDNPLRGLQLAGCRIDKVIGKGSVATVYKGHHLTLDIPVAIKILSSELRKTDSKLAQRFLKEAKVIARISHANIVSVMNAGEEHGHRFIVMQFVPGYSLAESLARQEQLATNDFVRVFLDVCNALNAAHEHSVVHGDIKPANILLTTGNNAMLVDFGLVKDLKGYRESSEPGEAMGTPLYMSPEQARGEHATDFRSDIYSLGATMYHVLAGRPPFPGFTALEVIRKHIEQPFPMPTELNIPVPGRMWEIVAKTMEKKPEDRYQSVNELKQDLLLVARDVAVDEYKPLLSGLKKRKLQAAP
jgi:tRNA A-37 threonylcarbamoyl transferase component Bud32/tetratricopeptide (TPR) repeat protein